MSKKVVKTPLYSDVLLGKREEKDIDLVLIISDFIKGVLGEEANNFFLKDLNIAFVKDKPSITQRIFISRYFRNILVKFRCYVEVENVGSVIANIIDDGNHTTWYNHIKLGVIPFLKRYKVLDFFIEREKIVNKYKSELLKKYQEETSKE